MDRAASWIVWNRVRALLDTEPTSNQTRCKGIQTSSRYNTSFARETIFEKFFSLNSRAIGPNTRVPFGLF